MTKAFASILVVLMLAAGVALLGYARWTRPLSDADAAFGGGPLGPGGRRLPDH